jgi:phospholipid transport system substrate-binding protein
MTFDPKRRLALRSAGALAGALAAPAWSAEEPSEALVARIWAFHEALLDVMKRAGQLGVRGRHEKLAPVIGATFDLPAMSRIAVGPQWNAIPKEQQATLIEAFSRMTIATYASRFDGYSGERFEVDPVVETRKTGKIVRTRLIQSNGEPIALNYLMRDAGAGAKVVDVYLTGTVSELATRRSEFAAILAGGGPQALIESLQQQADKQLQGARPATAR